MEHRQAICRASAAEARRARRRMREPRNLQGRYSAVQGRAAGRAFDRPRGAGSIPARSPPAAGRARTAARSQALPSPQRLGPG